VGLDASAEIIAKASADFARPMLEFIVGSAYELPFDDGTFDIVHTHQTLQHLANPVAALREWRRVTKPGGLVAAREVDYGGTFWFPELPGLTAWVQVYDAVHRSNRGEPNAGRRLKAWAQEAGFEQIEATASIWNFTNDDDREWWGSLWEERALKSGFASDALAKGFATHRELDAISRAWREWAEHESGWLTMPHGEILARA
jgi:SAM-dependent methyltransferase